MATPAVFVDGELMSTGKNKIEEPCACLYYLQEQARTTRKEPSLYRVKCKGCGREFLSNKEKEYCFECEEKSGIWRKKKENWESRRTISL